MRCGIDIISIEYICQMLDKHGWDFLNNFYSEYELKEMMKRKKMSRKLEYLAGRFAGKEAVYKAIQTNFDPRQLSILNRHDGKPYIKFDIHKLSDHCISISHYNGIAMAFVIINEV